MVGVGRLLEIYHVARADDTVHVSPALRQIDFCTNSERLL